MATSFSDITSYAEYILLFSTEIFVKFNNGKHVAGFIVIHDNFLVINEKMIINKYILVSMNLILWVFLAFHCILFDAFIFYTARSGAFHQTFIRTPHRKTRQTAQSWICCFTSTYCCTTCSPAQIVQPPQQIQILKRLLFSYIV